MSDNGGTATVADFDVSVDGVEVDWTHPDSPTGGTEVVEDLPGTYTLSEAEVDGYEEGQWACSDEFGDVPAGIRHDGDRQEFVLHFNAPAHQSCRRLL